MSLGGLLIVIGILFVLLDRFRAHKSANVNRESEIKIGNLSVKGGVSVLVLVLGVIVYLFEEGLLKF